MNTDLDFEIGGMVPGAARVVMDINYNYQGSMVHIATSGLFQICGQAMSVFLALVFVTCVQFWSLAWLEFGLEKSGQELEGTGIPYCGVWPIKCCQGSKTNKSHYQF